MAKRKKFRMKLVKLDKAYGQMVWFYPGEKSNKDKKLKKDKEQQIVNIEEVNEEDEEC